jgi:hypothetical protein
MPGSYTAQSTATNPITVTVTVTLTAAAPRGGALVGINITGPVEQGDNAAPYLSGVPSDGITIAQGQSSGSFQLQVAGCPSYSSGVYCDDKIDAMYHGADVSVVLRTEQ